MLSIKQKIIVEHFRKLYKLAQTPSTMLTLNYCQSLVKVTVSELYKLFPDKNIGKISINWFDSSGNKPEHIDENVVECFEICFHEQVSNKPWMICRFYKQDAKVRMFVC